MLELVVASQNVHKIQEIGTILGTDSIKLHALGKYTTHEVAETGTSFVENALIKARFACQETGFPALADDSGLIVPALQGEPGVRSARYAGDTATDAENNQKLLQEIEHIPLEKRQAYFVCVLVCLKYPSDPLPLIVQGLCHGSITSTPKGSHGFGYNPVFWVPEYHCTMAELEPEMKNQISHRAKALQQLKKGLLPWLSST